MVHWDEGQGGGGNYGAALVWELFTDGVLFTDLCQLGPALTSVCYVLSTLDCVCCFNVALLNLKMGIP